jgi:hypothetical protein
VSPEPNTFLASEPYANERYVYRSKDFAGACCHSPLSCAHGKKKAGVVSKEKATRVLSEAKEFVCSEREKEEKANLIKLMQQRGPTAPTTNTSHQILYHYLSPPYVHAGTCMCVVGSFCESCERGAAACSLIKFRPLAD